ncbi:MAG: DUF5666 domain-containing protein [Terriglobia bacterium]
MKPTPSPISRAELFITLCLLAGLIGIAGPARGFQQGGSNFGLEGKITRASPGKLTVSSQDNMIFHITYDERTKISRKDGSAGSAADLTAGTQIRVDGSLNTKGILEARSIHIE